MHTFCFSLKDTSQEEGQDVGIVLTLGVDLTSKWRASKAKVGVQ